MAPQSPPPQSPTELPDFQPANGPVKKERGENPASTPSSPLHLHPDADPIPGLRHARTTFRSPRRSTTSQQYNPDTTRGRRWRPGQEPGIDPNAVLPGSAPHLQTDCDITFAEFKQDVFETYYYDNKSLSDLMHDLSQAKPDSCKWINVNGLSWDVISALAKAKKFHRLAVEDVLSRGNRTKADWYADHAYIVLPFQKLIHFDKDQEEDDADSQAKATLGDYMSAMFKPRSAAGGKGPVDQAHVESKIESYGLESGIMQLKRQDSATVKTLQRYHGGINEERIEFMEKQSPLSSKGLGVSVEQVSIFLMADNTVVSFFEHSAQDIENPILSQLSRDETVLRRSGDSSMIVQAILDGIIDLALPVATAYHDAIDELELNVLTAPEVHHTRALYILQSEVSQLRSIIAPASGLIDALRDHSGVMPQLLSQADGTTKVHHASPRNADGQASSVVISPLARTYLADVADHVSVVRDNFEQMRRSSDNMTDLIFNTVSAVQNESMRQLTVVTILFLPLTFVTGYFGMNFTAFDFVHDHSDAYFWAVALPVVFVIAVWVLRDVIWRWLTSKRLKLGIITSRRRRERLGFKVQ